MGIGLFHEDCEVEIVTMKCDHSHLQRKIDRLEKKALRDKKKIEQLEEEKDNAFELAMRPLIFHRCKRGNVKSYPSILCSSCHSMGETDFNPIKEIEKLSGGK